MDNNLDFLKSIIDKGSLEEYLIIEQMEADILNLKNISNLDLYKLEYAKKELLKNLLYTIKKEQIDLFFNKLRLLYNSFNYKITTSIKNEDLERITKHLNLVDKIVKICLLKINTVLKKMQQTENNDKLLTIYLYLLALINLKNDCDKYYGQQVEIINNSLKNINVEFYNNIDIEHTLTNIEKVKALILTFN